MVAIIAVVVILVVLGLTLFSASVRILREYERGVVFRLGRLIELKEAGLVLLIPVVDRMVRVDLRVVTLNIPPQDIITRDNVPVRVTAVAYFRVIDANRAIVDVENFAAATNQIAQTSLRAVLGKADLDALLSERERLNEDLQQVIDQQTEPWGVKVLIVEIKDVDVPASMQRAIARQAEAERERRAKVINAEGEFQASAQLTNAADVMSRNPAALQLRYLQTLTELGNSSTSTAIIPLPLDVLRTVLTMTSGQDGKVAGAAQTGPLQPVPEDRQSA
jgi:regulator of protease activity HflC (stomatin/prohibitin superfamily)